jgi:tetratricopeptide (TPR) repeat protein
LRRIFEVLVIGIIASLIAGLILAPYLIPVFWKTYRTELYIVLLLIIILSLLYFIWERTTTIKKGLAEAFDVSRTVKRLTPADFHVTNYKDFYIERESDKEVENLLKQRKYIFITGIPMIGKTRMAYEATRKLKGFYLLKPKYERIDIQKLKLPLFRKKIVLFLDDLNKYVGKFNLDDLIRKLREKSKDFVVITTCRSGKEFDRVKAEKEMETLLTQCQKGKTEPRKLEPEEQKKLATAVDKRLERIASDGTPGSITIDLRYMKERYEKLGDEKSILKTLKLLREGNIFLWKENLVKEVSKGIFDLNIERTRWDSYMRSLSSQKFAVESSGSISVSHDVYLDDGFLDDYFVDSHDLMGLKDVLFHEFSDAENLFYLGNAFYYKDNLNEAEDCYRKSNQIDPDFALAYAGLADVYVSRYGSYNDRSLSVLDEAEKASKKALSIDQDLPEGHRSLGRVYMHKKMTRDAIKEFKQAIHIRPDFYEACRVLGWIYEELRNFEEATKWARKALEIRPTDREALLLLGITYFDQQLYDLALESFLKVGDVAPDYSTAFYYIGSTLLKLGKFDLALENFRKCIDAGGEPNVYLDTGWIYLLKKDYQKSLESFQKSIDFGFFEFLAYYFQGVVHQEANQDKKAEECFRKSVQLCGEQLGNDPENPYFHSTLGLAYLALGEEEKGEKEMTISKELASENGAILYDLARFYAKRDDEKKSLEFLKQALKLPLGPSKFEVQLDPHFKNLQKSPSFAELTRT